MTWSRFDLVWPWIGLAGAAGLLVPLLATRRLQMPGAGSRWRDPVWLAWLSVAAYLVHQVEEYGVDALGRAHAFPDVFCATLGQPPFPGCIVPPILFPAVNVSLVWIVGPALAVLARRRPLVGMGIFAVMAVNAVVHVVPLIIGRGYTPGMATALLVFAPLCVWIGHACFGPGRLFSRRDLALMLALGVVAHAVLMGSVLAFVRGLIGETALVALQFANAAVLPAVLWRWAGRAKA